MIKNKSRKLTLSEKILTYLSYHERNKKFSYTELRGALQEAYGKDYPLSTLRKEFSALKTSGFIETRTYYRKPVPTLSSKAKLRIIPHLAYKSFDTWDSKWRLVILNIPEKERKYRSLLAKNMESLGFRKVRTGVYMSPHPLLSTVRSLATEYGVAQHLTALEVDRIEEEKKTIQKIWKIDEINQEYKKFTREAKIDTTSSHWPLKAKILEEKFRDIYRKDPHLPLQLLPSNWQGDGAYRAFKRLISSYLK
jgi:DNA-binding transcriptional regulator PaaX